MSPARSAVCRDIRSGGNSVKAIGDDLGAAGIGQIVFGEPMKSAAYEACAHMQVCYLADPRGAPEARKLRVCVKKDKEEFVMKED